mmetsp:Transcript_81945/g.265588  ORF Transcript_81945/g.265588 Transcript_81945/m.265588 type:complete len:116 (-) Transcript_81945:189-536(-)
MGPGTTDEGKQLGNATVKRGGNASDSCWSASTSAPVGGRSRTNALPRQALNSCSKHRFNACAVRDEAPTSTARESCTTTILIHPRCVRLKANGCRAVFHGYARKGSTTETTWLTQ